MIEHLHHLNLFPIIGTFGLTAYALGASAATALGIGTAGAGIGASLYGANKQAKAVKSAADQNAAQQDKQNAAAWANYLMTRGINPNGVRTGEIPANPQAINARLPLWANVQRTPGGGYGAPGGASAGRIRLTGTARG